MLRFEPLVLCMVPSWWPTILLPPVIYTNSERLNLIFFFSLSSCSVNVYINSAINCVNEANEVNVAS